MRYPLLISVVAAILFLQHATTSAATRQVPAQTPPAQGAEAGRANRPAADALSANELVNMLDAYALVQAQQALTLNDSQYMQFVTRLKRLQEMRRRNQRDRNQILRELNNLAGPQASGPIDENAIRDRLKALREHDDRAATDLRKAYDTLDEVLDIRQQARFRIFEEMIERRKLDLLVRARERAARPVRR
jgi:hypothetical protein